MRSDPSDNGGLFPKRGSDSRQKLDRFLANLLFAAIVVGSLLCWGPIPVACLWVGSQVSYLSGSIFFGILMALAALFVLLFGMLMVLRRLDSAWILVRRAAGYDQRTGALGRVFAATAAICAAAFSFWFVVIHGPGSNSMPGNKP
jgi:hypothetical protein